MLSGAEPPVSKAGRQFQGQWELSACACPVVQVCEGSAVSILLVLVVLHVGTVGIALGVSGCEQPAVIQGPDGRGSGRRGGAGCLIAPGMAALLLVLKVSEGAVMGSGWV